MKTAAEIVLTADERETLEQWRKSRTMPHAKIVRARDHPARGRRRAERRDSRSARPFAENGGAVAASLCRVRLGRTRSRAVARPAQGDRVPG